jgi:hypothetical protein
VISDVPRTDGIVRRHSDVPLSTESCCKTDITLSDSSERQQLDYCCRTSRTSRRYNAPAFSNIRHLELIIAQPVFPAYRFGSHASDEAAVEGYTSSRISTPRHAAGTQSSPLWAISQRKSLVRLRDPQMENKHILLPAGSSFRYTPKRLDHRYDRAA